MWAAKEKKWKINRQSTYKQWMEWICEWNIDFFLFQNCSWFWCYDEAIKTPLTLEIHKSVCWVNKRIILTWKYFFLLLKSKIPTVVIKAKMWNFHDKQQQKSWWWWLNFKWFFRRILEIVVRNSKTATLCYAMNVT